MHPEGRVVFYGSDVNGTSFFAHDVSTGFEQARLFRSTVSYSMYPAKENRLSEIALYLARERRPTRTRG